MRRARSRIVQVLALMSLAGTLVLVGASPSSAVTGVDLCATVGHTAGFRNEALVTATAVGMAESSCNPSATNTNGPTSGCPNGSTDRGLWQINDCYHSEVSDSCAFNAQCNANAAYRISSGGTNWTQWTTYNSGSYRNYLAVARAAVARLFNHDYTGDGRADLLAINDTDGRLRIYPGNGAGGFTTPITLGPGWTSYNAIAGGADYTGDGRADLLGINDTDGRLRIYPGNGAGGFTTPITLGPGWTSYNAIA